MYNICLAFSVCSLCCATHCRCVHVHVRTLGRSTPLLAFAAAAAIRCSVNWLPFILQFDLELCYWTFNLKAHVAHLSCLVLAWLDLAWLVFHFLRSLFFCEIQTQACRHACTHPINIKLKLSLQLSFSSFPFWLAFWLLQLPVFWLCQYIALISVVHADCTSTISSAINISQREF